jgi:hypothetical protein
VNTRSSIPSAGAAFGLAAALATLFGQRREILRLKRERRDPPEAKSGAGVPIPPPGAGA